MAIMLGKTYAALKSAGASEEEAQAAAEELADYENRLVCRRTTGWVTSRPG